MKHLTVAIKALFGGFGLVFFFLVVVWFFYFPPGGEINFPVDWSRLGIAQ